MKIIILAGGLGTRLSEYTKKIPKPMVDINGKPILMHIIESYKRYGFSEFCIALGYKGDVIRRYFFDLAGHSESAIDELMIKDTVTVKIPQFNIDVTLANTGKDTLTGGRLKRLKAYIGNETFMLTYGDGLSDVNFTELLTAHKKANKLVTVTAVHPIARFGELKIDEHDNVTSFKEKPQLQEGWINGGFFILEPEFFKYIDNDETFLEREPIEKVAEEKQLIAYKHEGFWQCMDTRRDWELLKSLLEEGTPPWKINND